MSNHFIIFLFSPLNRLFFNFWIIEKNILIKFFILRLNNLLIKYNQLIHLNSQFSIFSDKIKENDNYNKEYDNNQ